jgi:glycosyltransferase involved in cell wall biosynthesis
VVATKIATNLKIIKHNYDGFLVKNTTKEWIRYISILIKNKKKRLLFGKRARLKVFKHYSVSSNKHKYLDILKKVFN